MATVAEVVDEVHIGNIGKGYYMSKVLIIGNGFDLDLGLKTSYQDFYHSKEFCLLCDENPMNDLFSYIKHNNGNGLWSDLESLIRAFFINNKYNPITCRPMWSFDMLTNALKSYLSSVDAKMAISKSIAGNVLSSISENGYFNSIFTFNYTDIGLISQSLGIKHHPKIHHIHGSLLNNLIIGIDEDAIKKIDGNFRRIIKVYSPIYRPSSLYKEISEADEVVFFGHSIGITDYPYFKQFLSNQSSSSCKSKVIRFFTKDNDSKTSLVFHLGSLTDDGYTPFQNYNEVYVYMTSSNEDRKEIDDCCRDWRDNSSENLERLLTNSFS